MPGLNQRIKAAIPNPVRRALANALRPVGAPARLRSLLAFDGTFALPLGDGQVSFEYANRWIERDLFWNGWRGYEPVSLGIWKRCVPFARTVVDIGANSGLFAVVAKVLKPASTVIAFEPLPMFADALLRNAALNGVGVTLVRAAVSDVDGRAQFFVPHEMAGNIYSSSLSRTHYERHQHSPPVVLDVDVIEFDGYADRVVLAGVDLVKIDAEGHDAMVVEGMRRTILRDRPDFLIEIQDDETGDRLMPLFPSGTYAYFNLSEQTGPRRAPRLGRSGTVNFFICKHATAERLGLPSQSA